MDQLEDSDLEKDGFQQDSQGSISESDWSLEICEAFLDDTSNSDVVSIAASSISHYSGKDFELEFQTNQQDDDAKAQIDESLTVKKDAENRLIWEEYHAGSWAPYPEYYLSDADTVDAEDGSTFDRLKATMVPLQLSQMDDCYIYKRTIHGGSGIPVRHKQIVVVHYAAYVEYADEPVDVAYSRAMKRSFKFQVDKGRALPGFELAIKSMHQGEAAIFIVSSSLAYGEQGCPPRYPGGADIFYFIELLNVSPNDPLELAMQLPTEERNQLDFTTVRRILTICQTRIGYFFKLAEFHHAQSYQRWTLDLLEHCSTADEREDKTRLKLLQSAFSNAAVIAHKMRQPKSVMYYTGNVLKMDKINRKALYLRILALKDLKERNESIKLCLRGISAHKDNDQFFKLMKQIQDEKDQEEKMERQLYARMLGLPSTATTIAAIPDKSPADNKQDISEKPAHDFVKIMADFKKSTAHELTLNMAGFTLKDFHDMQKTADIFRFETVNNRGISVKLLKKK